MMSILDRLIANPLGALAVLTLAALLEAYGDSFFQVGFYRSSGMGRVLALVAGALVLAAGVLTNHDGMPLAVRPEVLVIERVLARDEGCIEKQCAVVTTAGRLHQRTERFRAQGVAPAEVVEHGDACRVCTDCDRVADGFVQNGEGHTVGIALTIFGIESVGEYNAGFTGRANRLDDHRVGRRIGFQTCQRFDHCPTLYFVVVEVDDGGFGGNVRVGKEYEEGLTMVTYTQPSLFGMGKGTGGG